MSDPNQAQCDPTEKILYQEPHSDHWGTWQDRLFQTGSGERKGIGISVGGTVFVLPLKTWHELAHVKFPEKSKMSLKDQPAFPTHPEYQKALEAAENALKAADRMAFCHEDCGEAVESVEEYRAARAKASTSQKGVGK